GRSPRRAPGGTRAPRARAAGPGATSTRRGPGPAAPGRAPGASRWRRRPGCGGWPACMAPGRRRSRAPSRRGRPRAPGPARSRPGLLVLAGGRRLAEVGGHLVDQVGQAHGPVLVLVVDEGELRRVAALERLADAGLEDAPRGLERLAAAGAVAAREHRVVDPRLLQVLRRLDVGDRDEPEARIRELPADGLGDDLPERDVDAPHALSRGHRAPSRARPPPPRARPPRPAPRGRGRRAASGRRRRPGARPPPPRGSPRRA